MSREITQEVSGIAPQVRISILYDTEIFVDAFCALFTYLIHILVGDILITFDSAFPILRRKDGVILVDESTGYYATEPLRMHLPPPVTYGTIPW